MAYESSLAASLIPYTAGEQPGDGSKWIKLNTNENPYPPSPEVAKALAGKEESLRLYPDMDATALRRAASRVFSVSPEQVFCGNGSDEVLAFAFAGFFAGKDVYTPEIGYSFYPVYADLFGVHLRRVPMHPDFTVDTEGLMQGGPIVLANPNAPTSLGLGMGEIRKLAAHAKDAGEILLVDEAYADFAEENALSLLKEFPNLLIVRTFSKGYSLAGMRIGFALGHEDLIRTLKKVRDSFNSYPLDRLAQAAGEAAMLDTAYHARTTADIIAAREETRRRLTEAGVEVLPSQTNFLFVRADARDASRVQRALREEKILVRHFSSPSLAPYLRVSIGTMEEMQTVADALIRAIQREA